MWETTFYSISTHHTLGPHCLTLSLPVTLEPLPGTKGEAKPGSVTGSVRV